MPSRGKLHSALARHQGRNIPLELQKKHEKEVHKNKRRKSGDEGVQLQPSDAAGLNISSESRSRPPNDNKTHMSFGQSLESDDDMGSDEDMDDESADEEDGGTPLPNPKTSTRQALVNGESKDEDDDEDEDEDEDDFEDAEDGNEDEAEAEDEDESDVPLSDLASQDTDDENDVVPHQKLTINNTAALTASLRRIALPIPTLAFSEHMSVTSTEATNASIPDVNDDLNRELSFYAQSLAAVEAARAKLKAEGVPFTRPNDYFAEMVKTDEHMGKVKGRIVDDAARKRASQDAKRQRELRKFGKAVQQEKIKERAASKRAMLSRVEALKRKRAAGGAGAANANEEDLFDVALEDAGADVPAAKRAKREKPGKRGESNRKRVAKNERFGFGGKKRHAKSTDARSTGDTSGFSVARMKGKKGSSGAGKKRPGKDKRAKMR